jgi:glycosyltransferase involved in cell wall biosynthesis
MSKEQLPDVAVLVPARNEAASIARCLEQVLAQDVGRDRLEVIVVDGGSDDGTGEIAREVLQDAGLARWTVHRNQRGSTPSNLNAGLALVRAPVVCRVDARSLIPPHYVRTCAEVLHARPDVAVVGGAQLAVPRSGSARDRGIARALNNRYGMGLSRYRRGARSGPSDTVYLGAFRTTELRGATGWDERFGTNQDFDLNRRMAEHGIVWFDDSLEVGYLPRASVRELWEQYHRFGRWKVRYWRETGDRPQVRQAALIGSPLLVGLGIVATCRTDPKRWAAAVGVAALASVCVEHVGAEGDAPSASRGTSTLALSAVASGWLTGVLREWATGDR